MSRHTLAPLAAALFLTASLQASSFSTIYSFGDSLSDAGNIYTSTLGVIPGAPYVNGHFTNGQVWVQDLSVALGLGNEAASLQGGNDFAFGNAFSGNSPVHTSSGITAPTDLTGPLGQISQFQLAHPVADPNALYTVWIGSNDLLAVAGSNPNASQAGSDFAAIIGNIDSAILTLAGEGAKNFLVLTVPDLGKTPGVLAQGSAASMGASLLSGQFDTALAGALPSGGGLNISLLDSYSLVDGIIANGAGYGFSNVSSPCVTGALSYLGGTACSTTLAGQNQYLFWDQLHPTAAGHTLIADAAANTLAPEPATWTLLVFALLGLVAYRRRVA